MVISTRTVRVARELLKLNSSRGREEGFHIVMNRANDVPEDVDTPFEVQFKGPEDSPYEGRILSLQISFPISFPFEPPFIKFESPIYHPNIDSDGRICLDILKVPPRGCWRPTISLLHLLHAIKILLLEPNPDDPLVNEIAHEYLYNRTLYNSKASFREEPFRSSLMPVATNVILSEGGKESSPPPPLLSKKRSNSKLLGLLSKRPRNN